MKIFNVFATMTLTIAVAVCALSQTSRTPSTPTQNLVRGVVGLITTNNGWSNYSVFNLVPGSSLFPITSTKTVFYLGFTAGTEGDIGNMVVYTTARGSLAITAVTPVTLNGVSNPNIILTNTAVCPVAPSTTTPCIVRLDPTTLTLSPASDYYLATYFANDSNNVSLGAAQPGNTTQSSLVGNYFGGTDYTHLTVGQSLPGTGTHQPDFLMYVMNN